MLVKIKILTVFSKVYLFFNANNVNNTHSGLHICETIVSKA